MSEARLIFEIGVSGADVKELRTRLGLDSGYLSRLLRSLERQRLITTPQTSVDKRIRRAKLTRAGNAELKELNKRSDRLARSMLNPLNALQRESLIKAMREVERLLTASAVTIDEEAPHSFDARYCLGEYFRELSERFESGFDLLQSDSPTTAEFVPPDGTFLIVRFFGRPVGCGAFKRIGSRTAYLKRMWIAPDARGLGLGKRLLQALEERAWNVGYRKTRLETNKALSEAQQLYKRSGYDEIEAFGDEKYAHHWFEKVLRSRRKPKASPKRKTLLRTGTSAAKDDCGRCSNGDSQNQRRRLR